MNIQMYFIIYIIVINIVSFFIMKIDKTKARNNERRISEKTIFTYALLLGSIGVYAGMQKYRHKTKHLKFTILIPILILLNIYCVYYVFTNWL